VRRAKDVNLRAVAVSDHDAVAGIDPAIRAGELLNVEVVPAIEMSCVVGKQDVHVLGFYPDYHNAELLAFLAKVQQKRLDRAHRIVDNLNRQGVNLDVNRVLEIAQGGALGRPHIAQALMERGHVKNMDEAFYKFIGYHARAYVPKMEIAPHDAIGLIRRYGGIAVAAHPGSYNNDTLLNELIMAGLEGIEVYHPDHDRQMSEHLLEIARKNQLLVTGGSDCHGGRKGRIMLGEVRVPYANLAAMKKKRGL
jgi:predicted metal-dependent phosphoesterase TrpH